MEKEHPVVGLLSSPLPIDRVARRVTLPAPVEDRWLPKPKPAGHIVESSNVLKTARPPRQAPAEVLSAIGKRRGQMVVIGYAAEQPANKAKKGARWVVRCDCGNFEHRVCILRWIGTEATDMCRECRNRAYKRGQRRTEEKAVRHTLDATP